MPRVTHQFVAVFAALAITLVSMQVITAVPAPASAVIETPILA